MSELGDYYRARGWFLSGESGVSVPVSDVAPLLARLAKLEKVREAAERLADTVDGYDDLVRAVWDAIAACEEVKP